MENNELIIGILIYILSIYLHEFGHALVAIIYGKFVTVKYNLTPEVIYNTKNKDEEFNILIFGIVFGFIVIFSYGIYLENKYENKGKIYYYLLLFCYFYGCYYDVLKIMSIK